MTVRLTRRGRVVVGVAIGLLCAGLLALGASLVGDGGSAQGTSAGPAEPDGSVGSDGATVAVPNGPRPTRRWNVPTSRQALNGEIAGYARPYVLPGQPLELHVSTKSPEFRVVAYRIGDYSGRGGVRVGRWGPFPGAVGGAAQTDPETGAVRAEWPVSAVLDTSAWEPGLYLIGLWTAGEGSKRATVPVVVASPSAEEKVLLVAGDTTWQAYNTWGGVSAYTGADGSKESRSRAVSFSRPYEWSGFRWPAAFDIPLVRVAEAAGVPLAYASVTSLTDHPQAARGALGIVGNGHDEYWTPEYRTALIGARDEGTDLGFLGANAGYWRTEMRDGGWTAWMPKEGQARRWRDDPSVPSEDSIVGQLYDCYPAKGDMVITDPGFFLFEGTGVSRGSRLRNLIGNESDRFYPLPSTPRPIQVPALSDVDCRGKRTWSTVTYYTNESGAGVFSVGTMHWVRAMGGPRSAQGLGGDSERFTRAVTTNLLRAMAADRMGAAHPATDDFDDIKLPTTITSGSVLGTPDNPNLP